METKFGISSCVQKDMETNLECRNLNRTSVICFLCTKRYGDEVWNFFLCTKRYGDEFGMQKFKQDECSAYLNDFRDIRISRGQMLQFRKNKLSCVVYGWTKTRAFNGRSPTLNGGNWIFLCPFSRSLPFAQPLVSSASLVRAPPLPSLGRSRRRQEGEGSPTV
jgi:hypothetical protein